MGRPASYPSARRRDIAITWKLEAPVTTGAPSGNPLLYHTESQLLSDVCFATRDPLNNNNHPAAAEAV